MPRAHRFRPAIALVGALLALLGLTIIETQGCASNPVTLAQDSEQRAYAIYGMFVIVEEQGASVVRGGTLPDNVVRAIQIADAKAKPSADALLQAVRDFDHASHDFKGGTGSSSDLQIATAHLQQWVERAQVDVTALVSAVKPGG